ncbi:MAG: glycosidase [Archaeoglobales archaeon]|nr:MAG: glycosidase [Archaeoglobales archaeon]
MFKFTENFHEILERRENYTVDIAKRLNVITADRIHLKRFPISNPVTVFNPTMIMIDDEIFIYARIVVGYYVYASAIAEIRITFDDLSNSISHHSADIVIYPGWKYDIWGVEDPRVVVIDGNLFMTYCGRTVAYFDPHIRVERTLPITAIREERWRKICVHRFPENLRRSIVSDKDAFLVKSRDGLKLFHRPHTSEEKFYLTVSDVDAICQGCEESTVLNTVVVMKESEFEDRVGWGSPPVEVEGEYLFLLHGLERESKAYRVFAMTMNRDLEVTAVTPHYIMEPREIYEIYGDRPFVVFPCGSFVIDDRLIVSYGSADFAIGICEFDLSELMSILDKNRLE